MWRVQSGLVMNIHVLLYVLANRKWHHIRDSTHQKKKKERHEGRWREGRRKQGVGGRIGRVREKSDGRVWEVEADGERGGGPD